MQHYQTLLFDLDNTLVDFSGSEEKALDQIYRHHFRQTGSRHAFDNQFHLINRKLWQQVETGAISPREAGDRRFQKLISKLGSANDPNHIANRYEKALAEHTAWLPGTQATLDQLAKHYQLGIITNGLTMVQQLKYAHLNMQRWFSCYLISEQVGIAKPNPKIFKQALADLKANPETTLMAGDSLSSDYQGALNSGLDFCWINQQQKPLPNHLPKPQWIMRSVTEFKLPQPLAGF